MATCLLTKEQALRVARLRRTDPHKLVQVIESAEKANAPYTIDFPGCHLYMHREGEQMVYKMDGELGVCICVLSIFLGDNPPQWG